MSMSLRAYSRHRGTSVEAVRRAIKSQRLQASLVMSPAGKAQIGDAELADREWAANTDLTKAPGYVKARAAARESGRVTPPQAVTPTVTVRVAADVDEDIPSLAESAAREKHWNAKRAELKYKEAAKLLADAKKFLAATIDRNTRAKTKLLGLPSKMKIAIPHLTHAEVLLFDAAVREALEEIADEAMVSSDQSV